MGWLAGPGSPCPVLLASLRGLPDGSLPTLQARDRPSPPPGWQQEEEKKRIVSSWPRSQTLCPSALREPWPILPLPSTPIPVLYKGLRISQKSQAAFQGPGVRGGEISQPGPDPAPVSSEVPSRALSITPDFDPELQSQLVGRGLRKGRPRIRSLPSGDRTLSPQQLPLFSSSLSRQVSEGVWGDTAELNVLSTSTK